MFESASYSVSEAEGSVEVCVVRDEQAILEQPVSVNINTMPGSATLSEDFVSIDVMFVFNSDIPRQCADIVIQSDGVVEDVEVFTVNLVGVGPAVQVLTPSVSVEIEDASPLRVMFLSSTFQVVEGESIDVCLELLDAIVREVQLTLQVDDPDGEY